MPFPKLNICVLIGVIALLLKPADANYKKCITNVDYNKDYFPNKVVPKYSEQWDITYHNTYKILMNKNAGTSYLMYQCGTEPPSTEVNHTMVISVPLEDGIVVSSTTMIPHLEQLGLRRQIKAFLGSRYYITSPCISTLIDEGAIEVIYDEYSWSTEGRHVSEFLTDKPDAVVLRNYNNGNNTLVLSEFTEEGNLNTFEWVKVFSTLFNLEATANKLFDEAEARYQCNTDNAAYIAQQRTLEEVQKPTVAWAYYSNFTDTPYWDVASCDDKNYYCEFATRCAANLLHSNDGSIPSQWIPGEYHMTSEEFFQFAKDADYLIYIDSNWDKVYNKFEAELSEFKSVKNQQVYDTQGSGSSAWFEQRVAEFDIVLQDFCQIVGHYDNTLSPPHVRKYFRKIIPEGVEPVPEKEECQDGFVDLPWESRASECVLLNQVQSGSANFSLMNTLVLLVTMSVSMLSLWS